MGFRQAQQQIRDPERAAARGYHHERVSISRIGPVRGQRTELAALVVVVDAVIAPVTAAGHELEPTWRRSTATSCRSTISSAAIADSPRVT
jgi:hypothetical protein